MTARRLLDFKDQELRRLQRREAHLDRHEGDAGSVGGFSLHAGIAAQAHESQKLERLCR